MIIKFSEEEFHKSKSYEKLTLICERCGISFKKTKKEIKKAISGKYKDTCSYCSKSCSNGNPKKIVTCTHCKKEFLKYYNQIKKTTNHFCSKACSASYNNTHKNKGIRRSKLEKYLEEQLSKLYDFPIKYNSKTEINGELDIYIPHINIAFELNGIFHYKPIYGSKKLESIQNNDIKKYQACIEKGIELCVIDTSSQKYFNEQTSKKYLDIICNIINNLVT